MLLAQRIQPYISENKQITLKESRFGCKNKLLFNNNKLDSNRAYWSHFTNQLLNIFYLRHLEWYLWRHRPLCPTKHALNPLRVSILHTWTNCLINFVHCRNLFLYYYIELYFFSVVLTDRYNLVEVICKIPDNTCRWIPCYLLCWESFKDNIIDHWLYGLRFRYLISIDMTI